jgi:adenosylhomocysteine nucleosidase
METGEGCANAARAIRFRLDQVSTGAVILIGFAGALSPSLAAGDIVVAHSIRSANGTRSFTSDDRLMSAARKVRLEGASIHLGAAITVDEIFCEARAKRRLASALAENEIGCVDMESFAAAEVCAERGIPILVARAITDLFDEDLPVDFNRCRSADGRISDWKVLRAAMARPRALNALWRLRHKSQICAARLSLFVEELIKRVV